MEGGMSNVLKARMSEYKEILHLIVLKRTLLEHVLNTQAIQIIQIPVYIDLAYLIHSFYSVI